MQVEDDSASVVGLVIFLSSRLADDSGPSVSPVVDMSRCLTHTSSAAQLPRRKRKGAWGSLREQAHSPQISGSCCRCFFCPLPTAFIAPASHFPVSYLGSYFMAGWAGNYSLLPSGHPAV